MIALLRRSSECSSIAAIRLLARSTQVDAAVVNAEVRALLYGPWDLRVQPDRLIEAAENCLAALVGGTQIIQFWLMLLVPVAVPMSQAALR